jgi:DNA-binding FadR family transcriptional regulator
MEAAISRGEGAVGEDFALHRAIAVASGNPRFAELLRYLGGYVIPRQSVRVSVDAPEQQRLYLMGIQKEHARICETIAARRPADARKAMRMHLTNSLKRYRRLAERQLQSNQEGT